MRVPSVPDSSRGFLSHTGSPRDGVQYENALILDLGVPPWQMETCRWVCLKMVYLIFQWIITMFPIKIAICGYPLFSDKPRWNSIWVKKQLRVTLPKDLQEKTLKLGLKKWEGRSEDKSTSPVPGHPSFRRVCHEEGVTYYVTYLPAQLSQCEMQFKIIVCSGVECKTYFRWFGLRENLQETPEFHGKIRVNIQ